jgi:hypothetical protein
MKIYSLAITTLLMLSVVLLPSCKKGCTDTKAYNYTSGAKEDDASCLYCDSVVKELPSFNTNDRTYYDYYSGSPYYQSNVISIHTTGNLKRYNGNGCKRLGLGNGDACNTIIVTATVTNLTSKTITINSSASMSGSSQAVEYYFRNFTIDPFASKDVYIGTICDISTFYNFSFTNYNNGGYHVFDYR